VPDETAVRRCLRKTMTWKLDARQLGFISADGARGAASVRAHVVAQDPAATHRSKSVVAARRALAARFCAQEDASHLACTPAFSHALTTAA